MRKSGTIILGGLAVFGATAASAAPPALVPLPASVIEQPGRGFDVPPAPRLRVAPHDDAARAAATALRDRLAATTRLRPVLVETAEGRAGDIAFASDPAAPGGGEGYTLAVADTGVTIRASAGAGLYYGGVTLWQLLTQQPGGTVHLATMTIADQPRFAWRGLMLDSARHMQSVAYVERFLDWMAVHKLNSFHWHLSDDQGWRIEIKGYPRLTSVGAWRAAVAPDTIAPDGKAVTRYGGFYTQEQIRAVVAYAAARHITIVPEIDLPGHSTALIAAYPKLGVRGFGPEPVASDWGLLPEVLNTDEATITTVENILSEVMALFPGRFIHLGGDEVDPTQWQASAETRARMASLGLKDAPALERWFIARLGRFLEAHGRRLIGWDEIQDGATGAGLDAQAAIMSWHDGDGAAKAVASGHDAVIAQAPLYYLDNRQKNTADEPPGWSDSITARMLYEHDPVPAGLSPNARRHVLGLQGQMWTERARREDWVTQLVWPRAAAIAEVGWSPPARDWAGFQSRMAVQRARYRLIGLDAGTEVATPPAPGPRRASIDLDFCTPGETAFILEAPPRAEGGTALVRVSPQHPCWLYRAADLDTARRLDVAAVKLAFNMRLGNAAPIARLAKPRTAAGEIDVHLDGRDGPLLVSLPLGGWPAGADRHALSAALPAGQGTHDLYFVLTGTDIDSRAKVRAAMIAVESVALQ
ncbi:carbohydrate-binding protein [Sphingomonas populi]|uniref:beta-N-acetylhexosaminidase n=1 Tax=Sphingomonas populi TaxID=2484750 RepID=A0A4V2DDJ1_9SPHN|nr:family 20 glycosylhydrolase [Sphingomonas populi]RZF65168.1 carbohydrate-binding protein [Sphingomonas populi]